ncbi:uncharacterized protein LOC133917981 [Phragmites australis]|uniref:uncharacterized protein LOC133917981 n=1 Tax=Phragmites australis TaxID=29695 RepID=UPI002D781790|nr:uncharacterized protein LOC133917981 [Phragmites australis]
MSSDEREQLADRLAALSSSLPVHIVEFLKKQCGGDADPHGEFEINLNSMENSVLFELKKQLDEFAEKSKSEVVQVEEDEYVDICGDVSPITIRDASPFVSLEKAGETGNSPSSSNDSSRGRTRLFAEEFELKKQVDTFAEERKNEVVLDPEEEDEYVDICGGASPLGSPEKADESSSNDSGSSASDSDSASSCSSDSESDSESDSDSDESVSSPVPPSVAPKNKDSPAQPPEPALVVMQNTEPEMPHDESVGSPAPMAVLPEVNGTPAQPPPEPASEVVQSTEPEKLQDQRAAPAPKALDMASLIAKAREALEIRRQKGKG